ncbi:hypothetical protein VST7929_01194 [Vibrio stylophorae]|uniref:DUF3137 domain-containing protein n=1 Tax=Vibrio stylophorae TaxID=659351 RepID=A0ABM8ZSP1_9VIBR|nr:DUF3137 domain-containing protein [Vibrio stylophorae]CAH0533328.1 hypothetical protein VST7929_01194 [Vibrio stylophorae]
MQTAQYATNLWQLILGYPIDQRLQQAQFYALAERAPNFRNYYQQHIEPICQQYEQHRIPALEQTRQRFRYWMLPTLLACIFIHILLPSMETVSRWALVTVLYVVPLFFCFFYCRNPLTQLQCTLGDAAYPVALRYFGEDYYYNLMQRPALSYYEQYQLFPKFHHGTLNESISGTYQGLRFTVQEFELKRERSNNGKSSSEIVFTGIGIDIQCPKPFQGTTLVQTDKGTISRFFERQKMARVRLEDPKFERTFEVYGSDQIEARYLLSTAMMERLLHLTTIYGDKIQACFEQNRLFILIPSKHDYFCGLDNLYQAITFEQPIVQMFNEIIEIHQLIDILKLQSPSGYDKQNA